MSSQVHHPHWIGSNLDALRGPEPDGSFRISARALDIKWGGDVRFWEWVDLLPEERKKLGFTNKAAMLEQVNWLEVTGELNLPTDAMDSLTWYEIYYVMKFRDDAFGFHREPIKLTASLEKDPKVKEYRGELPLENYNELRDKWQEIFGGKFHLSQEIPQRKLYIGMRATESDWWKGGMLIAGINIKPSNHVDVTHESVNL